MLARPAWSPPGVDLQEWRRALAEDVLDVLAMLAEVEPAFAVAEADAGLVADVGWPGLSAYVLPDLHGQHHR